ncbi:unnamed protein product [Prunus armeniaca]
MGPIVPSRQQTTRSNGNPNGGTTLIIQTLAVKREGKKKREKPSYPGIYCPKYKLVLVVPLLARLLFEVLRLGHGRFTMH